MYKLMGVVEYKTKQGRKVKIVGNENGLIVKHTVDHPGKQISFKQVVDIVGKEVKLKKCDIRIPKHIEQTIKEKE